MEKLTTAQAAARSGASRFAIHRAIKSGALHPVRDNRGRYLFDSEELDAWSATRAHLVAQSLRDDSATEPATDAAQAEITALRDRLADAEKRAAVAEALAAERLERIDDLRIALAAGRWRWPWEKAD
jgi:excisionase family DNA binding protein